MRSDRSQTAPVLALVAVVVAIRLIVFPVNEHLYGDAVSRTEMSEQWARSPHVITSFGDGARQFGPLHLYMVAAALPFFEREDASRVVSLVFAALTVLPLFALTRRYFGACAAMWACLAYAVWGLHIQASTTGGSEAVALCFMWLAFASLARALDERRLWLFLPAALAMNLACALRYDAWMYVPLLATAPVLLWRDNRVAGLRAGVVFGLMCLPFPVMWMIGNALAHGDPLYPLTFIDEFHRTWASAAPRRWWLRVQGLGFWPAMALFTLTPGVAALGMAGMIVAWRRYPSTRWLTLAAVIPTLYYAFRTTVLFNFVPLGRFTVVQVSLLLPFIVPGFQWCMERWGATFARRFAAASIALAVVMPVALGLYTFRTEGLGPTLLRPLSPTSTNPRDLMDIATFVKTEIVGRGQTVALDEDTTYLDLQVGFFGHLTNEITARMRWPGFRERVERTPPDVVIVFDRGLLVHEPWVTLEGRTLLLGSVPYEQIDGFESPARIFRAVTK